MHEADPAALEQEFYQDYAFSLGLADLLADAAQDAVDPGCRRQAPPVIVAPLASLLFRHDSKAELITLFRACGPDASHAHRSGLTDQFWPRFWTGEAAARDCFALLRRINECAADATIAALLAQAACYFCDAGLADQAARRAVLMAPEDGLSHSAQGYAQLAAGDFEGAVRSFDHAFHLGYAEGHGTAMMAAIAAIAAGRGSEGEDRLARIDDPYLKPWLDGWRAMARLIQGDVEGALSYQTPAHIADVDAATPHANLAVTLAAAGRVDEAKAERQRAALAAGSYTLPFIDHLRPYARPWLALAHCEAEVSCSP